MGDLSKAKAKLVKKYGEAAVDANMVTTWIPTGIEEFDRLMGGGIPKGRVLELYGSPSAGKSTFMLWLSKQMQKAGEHVVWMDFENAFTQEYAEAMGVTMGDSFAVLHPDNMEQGFDQMLDMMTSVGGGIYVIDSLAAAQPKPPKEPKTRPAGLEKAKRPIGRFSAALGQCMQIVNNPIMQYGATLVVINQVRVDLSKQFLVTETTPGGHVLKHYASHRVRLRRLKREERTIREREIKVNTVEVWMRKTKLSQTEGEKMELWIVPGFGVRTPPSKGEDL